MLRSRVIPALALSAVLALTGCSGIGSDPAVSVNGTEYSVTELQQATSQLDEGNPAEPAQPQQVIADLALLPLLDRIFSGTPAEATDAQVSDLLVASGVADPGPATLAAARSRLYQGVLQDPATATDPELADLLTRASEVTVEDVENLAVEVNPRYGTWNAAGGGVLPQVPEWIRSTDAS